jgi:hypothetical protein
MLAIICFVSTCNTFNNLKILSNRVPDPDLRFLASRIRIRTAAERFLHACHHLLRVNLPDIYNLIHSNSVPDPGVFDLEDPDP